MNPFADRPDRPSSYGRPAAPRTPADHVARADDLLRLERYDLALAEVQQALALDPDNAEAHVSGAWILRAQKRYPAAEAAARAALAADPHLAAAHNALACVLWSAGRSRDADAAFRLMLACPQDHNEALFRANYARLLIGLNRARAGLEMADSALTCLPSLAVGHEVRGTALAALDRDTEAAGAFRQALTLDPRNFNAIYKLGRLELRAGQPAAALDLFRDALHLRPGNAEARSGLVTALKARNPIYGRGLGLFLRRQRQGQRLLWLVVAVIVFSPGLVSAALGETSPLGSAFKDLWQWMFALIMLGWGLVALGRRVLDPIFNMLLLRDPLGRLASEPDAADAVRVAMIGAALASGVGGIALGWIVGFADVLCEAALSLCGISLLGLLCVPHIQESRRRRRAALWGSYAVALAGVYGVALALILDSDVGLAVALTICLLAATVAGAVLLARRVARR